VISLVDGAILASHAKPTYSEVMRGLMAGWVNVGPLALGAGMAFWAEVIANASNYHADVFAGLVSAVRDARRADDILADLATGFKGYLQRSGDIAERTVLDFNHRLESSVRQAPDSMAGSGPARGDLGEPMNAVLRGIAELGMQGFWKLQESGAVDLARITQDLERLLGELGRLQRSQPSSPSQ
jgi:hypothetical protein